MQNSKDKNFEIWLMERKRFHAAQIERKVKEANEKYFYLENNISDNKITNAKSPEKKAA